jgi:hypothetical protein
MPDEQQTGQQYDTSQLDSVEHPTLGTLKFPKAMPPDERNASIDRMLKAKPANPVMQESLARSAQKTQFENERANAPKTTGEALTRAVKAPLTGDFWKQAATAAKGFVGGASPKPTELSPSALQSAVSTIRKEDPLRKAEGRNPLYRGAAAAGTAIGVPARQMEQQADIGSPEGIVGAAAPITAATLAPSFGVRALNAAKKALPGARIARAASQLGEVRGAAGNIPIDVSKAGNTALEIMKQTERGGPPVRAVRQIVQRMTDPSKGALTYEEAKDFQSNLSKLSASEHMEMKPATKRLVGQLNAELKEALKGAASQVGKGYVFSGAMKDYHRAAQTRDFFNAAKDAAVKSLPYGIGGTMSLAALKYLMGRK